MSGVIVIVLLASVSASALNPTHDISQYGHTAWTLREGTLAGLPRALTQTTDGYLWLATDSGLLRFDGVRFTEWQAPAESSLPSNVVTSLLASSDSGLWIGTTLGLARWHQGTLSRYTLLEGKYISALEQTRDGVVWVGTNAVQGNAVICAIRQDQTDCAGSDGQLGKGVLALHQDNAGRFWVGASSGLWRWDLAEPVRYPPPPTSGEIHAIIGEPSSMLVAVNRAVLSVEGGKFSPFPLNIGRQLKPTVMLRDRVGGLWVGTQDIGLLHVREGQLRQFRRSNGLSGDFVVSLFEDREGNVWAGTLNGLDRFRDVAATRLSAEHGLASDTVLAVQARRNGTVWLGTVAGLHEWRSGQLRQKVLPTLAQTGSIGSILEDARERLWFSSNRGMFYVTPGGHVQTVASVPAGYVHAMAEHAGHTVWISDQNNGLFRIDDDGVKLIPWSTFDGEVARSLAVDGGGGLWLGFVSSGLAYFKDGRVTRRLGAGDGLADGRVNDIHVDSGGAVWAATQGGLSRITPGGVMTLGANNGLPCSTVHWVIGDNSDALWIYTSCGVARVLPEELRRWTETPTSDLRPIVFDASDNVPRYSDLGGYGRKVTKATDGRLWFATYDGVGIIDPERLPTNTIPPPVQIESATADGVTYDVSRATRLPALVRDLRIDYSALSLVAPEKVRFRYWLEGRDHAWVDVGSRRQAYYTDLPPGQYRFRVIAANNRNVWNEVGAAWTFSIAPTFYQTRTFLATMALGAAGAIYGIYQFRVRLLAARLHLRFDERLAERTRISQELHDTLLQGFISSSMQLHVVAKQVTDERIRPELNRILGLMSDVLVEGRNAVQDLRAPSLEPLERALARSAEHFRGTQRAEIKVTVRGERREFHQHAYDASHQIGREALANAFKHAHPSRVEIDIDYRSDSFCLIVRDDGHGIDPQFLDTGRPGHWGLVNMRERAERLGGALKVWSRLGGGTEVSFETPGAIAFVPRPKASWRDRLRSRR